MNKNSAQPTTEDLRSSIAMGLDRLIDWAVATRASDVPNVVLNKAALVLIDDMAAMAAASNEPEVRALAAAAILSRPAEATLFLAEGGKVARQEAAFVNAVAGCWCELDGGYRGAPCHAGVYVLPTLLAEAEARGATLLDLLAWLAVAYEVSARLAECWRHSEATVHPHAAMAGMGAAMAAGIAGRNPSATVRRALAIAGGLVPAGGYRAAIEGAMVRNLWAGQGALIGIQSVRWAEAGLDGFTDGPHTAFVELLGATAEPSALDADLGSRWAIAGHYHKLHGCCHSTHSAVEAALELRPAITDKLDTIKRITLFTHRPSMSNRVPGNSLAARFSFEHVLATTLVHGHAMPRAFGRAAIGHPQVARLREVVTLEPYPDLPAWPHDRAAKLEIVLCNEKSQSTTCLSPLGGPDRPLDPDALLEKIEAVAGEAFPGLVAAAAQIVEGAWRDEPWGEVANRITSRG